MPEDQSMREQIKEMVQAAERAVSKELIEDFRWELDCGRPMGEPRAWVELAPGLQVMVHPGNVNHVLLFYPRAKHWLDPEWVPSVYGPFWK